MKPGAVLATALVSLAFLAACQIAPRKSAAAHSKPIRSESDKLPPATARYIKKMEDRLGTYWYALDKIHLDELHVGTVTATFEIPAAGGKVRNVKVTSNTGGRSDALVALRAIDQFRAPPIPADVLAEAHQDYVVVEESFMIFANP
ncbi:MAG: hypothetical protein ACR2II_13415 [Chthoniobacterales bacterium]